MLRAGPTSHDAREESDKEAVGARDARRAKGGAQFVLHAGGVSSGAAAQKRVRGAGGVASLRACRSAVGRRVVSVSATARRRELRQRTAVRQARRRTLPGPAGAYGTRVRGGLPDEVAPHRGPDNVRIVIHVRMGLVAPGAGPQARGR